MATSGTAALIQNLRRMALRVDGNGISDGQLLEAFVCRRDAAAFEALLRRHGPMVLGVCRRVLRNPHDAEDAFQSTFLVLARKAAAVSPRERVGSWLYGVARVTAIRLRAANTRRRTRERQTACMAEPQTVRNEFQDDLRQQLDEELARLPQKLRVPIILCDLEGRTRREVARQLQLPEGTLSSRLTTGRRMLAKRLARHGLAVSGGALAAALSQNTVSATLSVSLVGSTVKAAMLAAAGQMATGLISAPVAALMEGVLKAMFLTKLKTVLGVTLVIATLGGAAGLIYQTRAAEQAQTPAATESASKQPPSVATTGAKPRQDRQQRPEDDALAIQGVWRVVAVQHRNEADAGEEAAGAEGSRWFIRAHSMEIRSKDGQVVGFTYKLDPSTSPKLLELQILGRTIPALYALDSDVLQIRIGIPERTRPKALFGDDSPNTRLLILKREAVLKRKPERPKKENKQAGRETEKKDETATSRDDGSLGYIKIKTGPQEYKALFIKMLGVLAEDFENIIYANQYEGRIEAYKTGLLTSRPVPQYGFVQHAFIRFEVRDDGYLIAVRINKIRMSETEEVVGRDTKREQAILKKLKAQSSHKDSQREKMIQEVYNVSDLIVQVKPDDRGAELLIRKITETLQPRSWAGNGGDGTIDYHLLTRSLVINQTAEIQEQVQDLLDALRRVPKKKLPSVIRP